MGGEGGGWRWEVGGHLKPRNRSSSNRMTAKTAPPPKSLDEGTAVNRSPAALITPSSMLRTKPRANME